METFLKKKEKGKYREIVIILSFSTGKTKKYTMQRLKKNFYSI